MYRAPCHTVTCHCCALPPAPLLLKLASETDARCWKPTRANPKFGSALRYICSVKTLSLHVVFLEQYVRGRRVAANALAAERPVLEQRDIGGLHPHHSVSNQTSMDLLVSNHSCKNLSSLQSLLNCLLMISQISFFVVCAIAQGTAFIRWRNWSAQEKLSGWRLYGWLTGLSCLGSV